MRCPCYANYVAVAVPLFFASGIMGQAQAALTISNGATSNVTCSATKASGGILRT